MKPSQVFRSVNVYLLCTILAEDSVWTSCWGFEIIAYSWMYLFLYMHCIYQCSWFSWSHILPKNTKCNTFKVVLMMRHESILLVSQNVDSYVFISEVMNWVVHFSSTLAHLCYCHCCCCQVTFFSFSRIT